MITTEEAIRVGRSMLGTPYSTLDCINFIKAIIRKSVGGDPKYTDAHVPALWASYESSGKYRHLIARQENLIDPKPGMLAFKGKPWGHDREPSHVGLVTSPTTVIHSSSAKGCVVETDLLNGQWTLLGVHKLIRIDGEEKGDDEPVDVKKRAIVNTESGSLNVRQGPSTDDGIIFKLPKGSEVGIVKEVPGGWSYITCDQGMGYASSQYLMVTQEDQSCDDSDDPVTQEGHFVDQTFVNEQGGMITLHGIWRLAVD